MSSAAAVEPDLDDTESDDVEQPVDSEPIMPVGEAITIAGVPCEVRRLRTREFLSLVNVVTRGLGGSLAEVQIDFSDEDSVAADLSALMLLALPNAVDEFTVFLRIIVDPINSDDAARVATYLSDNPEIGDLLDIFEVVVTQEKNDLVVLAGKAQAVWTRLSTLYQKPSDRVKKKRR